MSKTNTLTSHHPERESRRVDKMSNNSIKGLNGKPKKNIKKNLNKENETINKTKYRRKNII